MVVDIAGLTGAVTKTAITIKAFDTVDRSVRKIDRASKKSKRKDFW